MKTELKDRKVMVSCTMTLPKFKQMVDFVGAIATETIAVIDRTGTWDIRVVDTANVSLLCVNFSQEYFITQEFACAEDISTVTVVLDAVRLRGVKFTGGKTTTVQIDIIKRATGFCPFIRITSGRRVYLMPTTSPSVVRKPPKLPELTHSYSAIIDAGDFHGSVVAINRIADKCVIGSYTDTEGDQHLVIHTGTFNHVTDGVDVDEMGTGESGFSQIVPTLYCNNKCINSLEDVRSYFSTDYLVNILKIVARYYDTVVISIAEDHPIAIGTSTEGRDDGFTFTHLLAPRIEVR